MFILSHVRRTRSQLPVATVLFDVNEKILRLYFQVSLISATNMRIVCAAMPYGAAVGGSQPHQSF